jgi:hypothetical protein
MSLVDIRGKRIGKRDDTPDVLNEHPQIPKHIALKIRHTANDVFEQLFGQHPHDVPFEKRVPRNLWESGARWAWLQMQHKPEFFKEDEAQSDT